MLGKDIYASKYRDKSQDGIEMMHLSVRAFTDTGVTLDETSHRTESK